MDRRSFIYGVTGLVLGSTVRNMAEGEEAAPDIPPRLKMGFLGAAYSHAAPKLALLRDHPDFELTGVWDDDAQVRERVSGQGYPVLPQDEVLGGSDVIAVESVVRDHARHARMALAAGKHVHLEKPPSLGLVEFQEVVQLAQQKCLVLQGGYQYRHSPAFQAVMEAAHAGWLGDVYLVRATLNNQLALERRRNGASTRGARCTNWAAIWSMRWCVYWADPTRLRRSCAPTGPLAIRSKTIRSPCWSIHGPWPRFTAQHFSPLRRPTEHSK